MKFLKVDLNDFSEQDSGYSNSSSYYGNSNGDFGYEDEDWDNWDAYTDGQYGDYKAPNDPELIGL